MKHKGSIGLLAIALAAAGSAGCSGSRAVYFTDFHENRFAIPVQSLADSIRSANGWITEGIPWSIGYDSGAAMRLTNMDDSGRHATDVDFALRSELGGGSAFQATVWSRAYGGRVTFGITSTALQQLTRRKAITLIEEVRRRASGISGTVPPPPVPPPVEDAPPPPPPTPPPVVEEPPAPPPEPTVPDGGPEWAAGRTMVRVAPTMLRDVRVTKVMGRRFEVIHDSGTREKVERSDCFRPEPCTDRDISLGTDVLVNADAIRGAPPRDLWTVGTVIEARDGRYFVQAGDHKAWGPASLLRRKPAAIESGPPAGPEFAAKEVFHNYQEGWWRKLTVLKEEGSHYVCMGADGQRRKVRKDECHVPRACKPSDLSIGADVIVNESGVRGGAWNDLFCAGVILEAKDGKFLVQVGGTRARGEAGQFFVMPAGAPTRPPAVEPGPKDPPPGVSHPPSHSPPGGGTPPGLVGKNGYHRVKKRWWQEVRVVGEEKNHWVAMDASGKKRKLKKDDCDELETPGAGQVGLGDDVIVNESGVRGGSWNDQFCVGVVIEAKDGKYLVQVGSAKSWNPLENLRRLKGGKAIPPEDEPVEAGEGGGGAEKDDRGGKGGMREGPKDEPPKGPKAKPPEEKPPAGKPEDKGKPPEDKPKPPEDKGKGQGPSAGEKDKGPGAGEKPKEKPPEGGGSEKPKPPEDKGKEGEKSPPADKDKGPAGKDEGKKDEEKGKPGEDKGKGDEKEKGPAPKEEGKKDEDKGKSDEEKGKDEGKKEEEKGKPDEGSGESKKDDEKKDEGKKDEEKKEDEKDKGKGKGKKK